MKPCVVAIVFRIREDGKKEYLFERTLTDYGKFTGFLQPPSGRVEEGETTNDAIRREVSEELGVTVTSVKKITESAGDTQHLVCRYSR